MKQFYLIISVLALSAMCTFAQTYPLVTIQQIQQVPNDSLGTTPNGDLSNFDGDTVRVRGIVVTPPGVGVSSSTWGRWIWIQDGSGPWSGLNVRVPWVGNISTIPDDMLNVVPGDSVEIVGVVNTFANETQISPIENGDNFFILTGVTGLRPVEMVQFQDLSALDGPNANIPSSAAGEPWEASFVEIFGVTVSDVVTTTQRVRFQVEDNLGNTTEVYDTYTVQRLSPPGNPNEIPYPSFPIPAIGDQFDTIRGIVDGRNQLFPPYNIAPFDTTHYVYGPAAPRIQGVFRDIAVPTDADQVTVTASISDNGGSIVGTPQLYYAFGESNTNFTPVGMTFTGSNNQYTAVIPAGSDGQMVKFYLEATDNDNNTSVVPNPDPNEETYFYFVRNNGKLTVRDIQYTIYDDGDSGYEGQMVTVEGIVTASVADDDFPSFVYIQDVNTTEWGGIRLVADGLYPNFTNTPKGDFVRVTGMVEESFGFTQIRISDNNDFQVLSSVGTPSGIELDPADFTSYSFGFEKYEGLLVKFSGVNPGDSIYVVEENADAPGVGFGEYRIGRDLFNPSSGCRVLVGHRGNQSDASLNASYIGYSDPMDPITINVQPIEVLTGDRMTSIQGIMFYSFGDFKLLPRSNSDFPGYAGNPASIDRSSVRDLSVQIYPNPSTDIVNFVSSFDNKTYQLELYDVLGQKVYDREVTGKFGKMDLRMIDNGQYILRVTEKGAFVESFQLVLYR